MGRVVSVGEPFESPSSRYGMIPPCIVASRCYKRMAVVSQP
jgi:hypothetical protein